MTHKQISFADLVKQISEVFPDHYVEKQAESNPPLSELGLTESLAAYIVKEARELFDENAPKTANLERLSSSLERSANLLEQVSAHLRRT